MVKLNSNLEIRSKGFTLIELLVALFIMVLLAGTFTINLNRGRDEKEVKNAASIIKAQILEARAEAMVPGESTRNLTYNRLYINNCSASYVNGAPSIYFIKYFGAAAQTQENKPIDFGPNIRIKTTDNTIVSGNTCYLSFSALNGKIANIGTGDLHLQIKDKNSSTDNYTLTINRYTANTTIAP